MNNSFNFDEIVPIPLYRKKDQIRFSKDFPLKLPPKDITQYSKPTHVSKSIREAREKKKSVVMLYGAHLIKNGLSNYLSDLIKKGWVTHIATNGAGLIHDWELAYCGKTSENVEENIANGTFGTWDETGRVINRVATIAASQGFGLGKYIGALLYNDKLVYPRNTECLSYIHTYPQDPKIGFYSTMSTWDDSGRFEEPHLFSEMSVFYSAYSADIPATIHPGIGYDITHTTPHFNGAALGACAETDFKTLCKSLNNLSDGGVILSVGSAIMAPQVIEKAVSCVNNWGIYHEGVKPLKDFKIFIVDIQDGGGWDWSQGEPPKDHPAYYLRFCKSFYRISKDTHYIQQDNVEFMTRLYTDLH